MISVSARGAGRVSAPEAGCRVRVVGPGCTPCRSPLAETATAADACGVRRIVVGVDGSAESRAALRWAAEVAAGFGAAVEAVQVWQYPPALQEWDAVPSNYGYLPSVPGIERVERGVRDGLAATVALVLGPEPGVEVAHRVVEGHPARVLIEAADGALLLVVGRRGHGGLVGLLLDRGPGLHRTRQLSGRGRPAAPRPRRRCRCLRDRGYRRRTPMSRAHAEIGQLIPAPDRRGAGPAAPTAVRAGRVNPRIVQCVRP